MAWTLVNLVLSTLNPEDLTPLKSLSIVELGFHKVLSDVKEQNL